jgi:hypothetical protein
MDRSIPDLRPELFSFGLARASEIGAEPYQSRVQLRTQRGTEGSIPGLGRSDS